MNGHETTVLSARLHALADDMTPPLDVVGQVRAAREKRRHDLRGRIAVLAAATATAALVVGTVTATDLLAGGRTEAAVPSAPTAAPPVSPTPPPTAAPPVSPTPTPTATEPVEPTPPSNPAVDPADPSGPLAGWEVRRFGGVTFAVPPGARATDTVDTTTEISRMAGPSLRWNGPVLTGGQESYVKVMIVETFEGGLTPTDGGEYFDVPGAELAYGGIDAVSYTGEPLDVRTVWMRLLVGDRQVLVDAVFPGGPEGDQMARDLIASIAVP